MLITVIKTYEYQNNCSSQFLQRTHVSALELQNFWSLLSQIVYTSCTIIRIILIICARKRKIIVTKMLTIYI